jgi:FKBP-type peptidyl-prolyl cis-trans isomerase FklB
MKRTRILIAVGLFSALAAYAQEDTTSATPSASPAFTDDKDKISYSVGVDIGQTLKKLQLELNQDVLIQGLSDVLSDRPTAMTDQELQQTLQAFQQNMMQKQQAELTKKQA